MSKKLAILRKSWFLGKKSRKVKICDFYEICARQRSKTNFSSQFYGRGVSSLQNNLSSQGRKRVVMRKCRLYVLLALALMGLSSCYQMKADDYVSSVPTTNNPQFIPARSGLSQFTAMQP